MYEIKRYAGGLKQWRKHTVGYKTESKAIVACYDAAISEAATLMQAEGGEHSWFEVEKDFEITDAYMCKELEGVVFFPIAVVYYDKAPWDRENDCEIRIISGYLPEAISDPHPLSGTSVLDEIRREIRDALGSNFRAKQERVEKKRPTGAIDYIIEGKIAALRGLDDYLDEHEDRLRGEWRDASDPPTDENTRVLVYLSDNGKLPKIDTDRYAKGHWVRWGTFVSKWRPISPEEMYGVK
ncbi:MAG: hypothetical protein IKA41_01655 [Bacteroidaceae bacterium]|nr:hypothetical protein [Bacteroidaceae bacterium]